MEAANNEGNGFIEMVFIGIEDNNVIVSEQRWVQLIEFLFQGGFWLFWKKMLEIFKTLILFQGILEVS